MCSRNTEFFMRNRKNPIFQKKIKNFLKITPLSHTLFGPEGAKNGAYPRDHPQKSIKSIEARGSENTPPKGAAFGGVSEPLKNHEKTPLPKNPRASIDFWT